MGELLGEQFPDLAHLEVRAVHPGGWDHRSFRVGSELVARLPSDIAYAAQVVEEHRWLPLLARHLPLEVPTPVAIGKPGKGYKWTWSIRRWIEGVGPCVADAAVSRELARFLIALRRIDSTHGPPPGVDNFHRGGHLRVYDKQVHRALAILEGRIDDGAALALWRRALETRWNEGPVWVHGDISPGNLLMRNGRLAAAIDFGNLAVGDPACDLAIAWAWLDGHARQAFREGVALDDETWLRGRAWALWKALIVAAGIAPTNAIEYSNPLAVIKRCLDDAGSRPSPG